MAKLNKPKYLKLFDIQRIIKYIFCSEKRPHYMQLIPKPDKIALVLIESCDPESQKTEIYKNRNNKSSKDVNEHLHSSHTTAETSDEKLKMYKNSSCDSKSSTRDFASPLSNFNESIHDKSYLSETTVSSVQCGKDNINFLINEGFTKVHINESFSVQDLYKNILKHKSIDRISFSILTENNLKMIERHDIYHLFSYSNFIKSQTQLDISIFKSFKRPESVTKYFLIALDCEMMICKSGSQIGRISMIDHTGKVIYDKYVKPNSEVIDYLEQYSGLNYENTHNGISFDQMKNEIFQIIGSNTIIVGHGLENDLEALQLYSENLIDTSYLFLNSDGHKIKLSQLSKVYFSDEIQINEHSSIEDALCCLRLLSYKLNEIINFYDPNGEYLDINLKCKNINKIDEISNERTLYFMKRSTFDLNDYPNVKGLFYLFLTKHGNQNYIYLKQKQ